MFVLNINYSINYSIRILRQKSIGLYKPFKSGGADETILELLKVDLGVLMQRMQPPLIA
jgi:hypothetical protein